MHRPIETTRLTVQLENVDGGRTQSAFPGGFASALLADWCGFNPISDSCQYGENLLDDIRFPERSSARKNHRIFVHSQMSLSQKAVIEKRNFLKYTLHSAPIFLFQRDSHIFYVKCVKNTRSVLSPNVKAYFQLGKGLKKCP